MEGGVGGGGGDGGAGGVGGGVGGEGGGAADGGGGAADRGGGAAGEGRARVFTTRLQTPLGEMVAGAADGGVCLLEFAGRKGLDAQLTRMEGLMGPLMPGPHPAHAGPWIGSSANTSRVSARSSPCLLVLAGTTFQERVWRALREIPYGTTINYAELARRVGSAQGVRAVGTCQRRQPDRHRRAVPSGSSGPAATWGATAAVWPASGGFSIWKRGRCSSSEAGKARQPVDKVPPAFERRFIHGLLGRTA